MVIRRAEAGDIGQLIELLKQVNKVHHDLRPDIFNLGTKYTEEQLNQIIGDEERPILNAVEDGKLLGYAFCVYQTNPGDNVLTDIKTLYLDDLCVDEAVRGRHIGEALYRAVVELAKATGCYHVTLNVWTGNSGAERFYQKCGMKPLKTYMEQIIDGNC